MNEEGLSIIVPLYNEETAIKKTVLEIDKYAKKSGRKYEILIIDDGSKDSSATNVPNIKSVKLIRHKKNKGYSSAIKTGLLQSKYPLIMITDSDGTYPIYEIPRLLSELKDYDMIVGARNQKDLPILTKPAKAILGRLANFVAGTKIPDINSGMRIFKKEMAMQFFNIYPKKFSFTLTITLAALINNYDVKFVQIEYNKRVGSSKIHPIKDTINFIGIILRVITLFNPLKAFSIIAIILVIIGILIAVASTMFTGKIMDVTTSLFIISAIQIFIFGILADLVLKNTGGKKEWAKEI